MIAVQPQYIEIRTNRDGQERPYINGTRVRVQDIVIQHERFGQTAEEIARGFPHLSMSQVYAALAYFFEDREAVWSCIREDEAFAAAMEMQFADKHAGGADAGQPSVSS